MAIRLHIYESPHLSVFFASKATAEEHQAKGRDEERGMGSEEIMESGGFYRTVEFGEGRVHRESCGSVSDRTFACAERELIIQLLWRAMIELAGGLMRE